MSGSKVEKSVQSADALWAKTSTLKPVLDNVVSLLAEVTPSALRDKARAWEKGVSTKLAKMANPDFQTSVLALHKYIRSKDEDLAQLPEKNY